MCWGDYRPRQFHLARQADRRTSFYPNVWDVFGGHVEPGESRERTLQRELQEELGIVPTAWRYLETLRDMDTIKGAGLTCHFYVVTDWSGTPKNMAPQEHSDISWYRFEEVTQLELAHPVYIRIFQNAKSLLERSENRYRNGSA